jgi:hypothetical protein
MAQNIMTKTVTITTTGGAGASTGYADFEDCHGFLLDVYNNWHASAPVSSVATLKFQDPSLGNIIACPATATDTLYAPRKEVVTVAGASTGLYDYFPVNGVLRMTVTLSNDLTGALVSTIRYLQL